MGFVDCKLTLFRHKTQTNVLIIRRYKNQQKVIKLRIPALPAKATYAFHITGVK